MWFPHFWDPIKKKYFQKFSKIQNFFIFWKSPWSILNLIWYLPNDYFFEISLIFRFFAKFPDFCLIRAGPVAPGRYRARARPGGHPVVMWEVIFAIIVLKLRYFGLYNKKPSTVLKMTHWGCQLKFLGLKLCQSVPYAIATISAKFQPQKLIFRRDRDIIWGG
jgi:hypothetical protein